VKKSGVMKYPILEFGLGIWDLSKKEKSKSQNQKSKIITEHPTFQFLEL
jgi:hypothetical protein